MESFSIISPILRVSSRFSGAPLEYLTASGERARTTLPLTWWVLGVSLAVIIVISGLVLVAILRRRARSSEDLSAITIADSGPVGWIYWGVGVSFIPLVATVAWTTAVLASLRPHAVDPAATIEVTAHQWWWGARYLDKDVSRIFTTANEIHIPAGRPVKVELRSADVIHSFWAPALAGKTDAIPGRTNIAWLEADRPGRYRGQCQEYCGFEHALMGFEVVADRPEDFERWRDGQLKSAPKPTSVSGIRGRDLFVFHCGSCHAVRGTDAGGHVAPDLTHLMSRRTIAATALPNNVASLSAWIIAPDVHKPGTYMPAFPLEGPDLEDLRTYLETLQ